MRQMISGLVAAVAVMAASAVPAMACGGGLFSSCSPCGQQEYVSPCAQPQVYVQPEPVYVAPAPTYGGCNSCGGGWAYEHLPDPVHQYYYVNQGPTYTGPGNFAPRREYDESANLGWSGYHHRHHYGYGYGYGYHHTMRYGMMSNHYGYGHYGYGRHEHALRRYY